MFGKNKKKINKNYFSDDSQRPVDKAAEDVYSWWNKEFVFVGKKKVKTWKAFLIIFFLAGAFSAIVISASINLHNLSVAEVGVSSLSLFPEELAPLEGEEFNVDVLLDTKRNNVVAVKAMVNYDTEYLELKSWDTGDSAFSRNNTCVYQSKPCEIVESYPEKGELFIVLAKPTPGVDTSSGVVASLTFKALKQMPPRNNAIEINFNSTGNYEDSDVIFDDGKGSDILNSVKNSTISINVLDNVPPILTETKKIESPSSNNKPAYTFNSSEKGIISYSGSCSSEKISAGEGNNTIIFNELSDGVHTDCYLIVTDISGNESSPLHVSSFEVEVEESDTVAPILKEMSAISTPTVDNTPTYKFSSTEKGKISYGGSCDSSAESAEAGTNSITFEELINGTYSNCLIYVTDEAGNRSQPLEINSFTVDVPEKEPEDKVAPEISNDIPDGVLPAETDEAAISVETNETASCRYATRSNWSYKEMRKSMKSDDGLVHHATVSKLKNGEDYSYYIRCQDGAGNESSVKKISFSIASSEPSEEDLEEDADQVDEDNKEVDVGDGKSKIKRIYSRWKEFTLRGSKKELRNGILQIWRNGKQESEVNISDSGEWKVNIDTEKDGEYKYEFKFLNPENEEMEESNEYEMAVDSKEPKITELPIFFTKSPGEKVWWQIKNSEKTDKYKFEFLGKEKETERSSFTIPSDAPKGVHTLKVKAFDKAGNMSTRWAAIRIR